jgi:ribonucleotide monophosphatase NagD (HAD superfamily)
MPGAVDFIHSLREQGVAYLLLTNNFAYTPLDVAVKLKRFGIETREENVYTAAITRIFRSMKCWARLSA